LFTAVSSVGVEVSSNAIAVNSLHTRVSSVGVEVDSVQSYVAAILDDTGTSGVVVADKTGFSLAADQSGVTIGTVNAIAGTITTLDALDTAQDTQHTTTRTAISSLDVRVTSADTRVSSVATQVSSVGVEVGSNAIAISSLGGTSPTAGQIADAVWDEAIADHLGAGSTGASLNAAGSAGDPWTTTLPGAYTGTQAGALLGSTLSNSMYARVDSSYAAVTSASVQVSSNATAISSLHTRVSSMAIEVDSIQQITTDILDDTGNAGVQVADKAGYSISGTIQTLDALDTAQDGQHTTTRTAITSISTQIGSIDTRVSSAATQVGSVFTSVGSLHTRVSSITGVSSATITAAVWEADLSGFTTNGTTGKVLKGISEGWLSAEGAVNDASATTTSFVTNLDSSVDDFYNGHALVFVSGSLNGQSQIISDYVGSTKTVTLDHALTSAPANSDTFVILNGHQHTTSEIISMVNSAMSGTAVAEPTSVPAANASITEKLSWLYMQGRNRITQTGSIQTVYADNSVTVVSSASTSDDGTTFTRGKHT